MKVLGLDLGVASIGWALIELDDNLRPVEICGLGSRIVNLAVNEDSDFIKGKGESVNSQRTLKRTQRKGFRRFEMRRDNLLVLLSHLGMVDKDNSLLSLPPLELWHLRARAATDGERLSLPELGRVLRHLNAKRGYKHAKTSSDSESKDTAYVEAINNRYAELKESGLTIGQKFFAELQESEQTTPNGHKVVSARLSEGDPYSPSHLLPRQAHIDEYDRIMDVQKEYYPEILTTEVIERLRRAIFFQRPLKSCKHLVSDCEFISHTGSDGNTYRPKVAPSTSPLAEVTRIWEAVNNIRLSNRHNKPRKIKNIETGLFSDYIPEEKSRDWRLLQREFIPDSEERLKIFQFLMDNPKMSSKDLLKILGLKVADGFTPNIDSRRGLKGNVTRCEIKKALGDIPGAESLLRFVLKEEQAVDNETGEITRRISGDFKDEPFYRLWHLLYSVEDKECLTKALQKQFGITDPDTIDRLYNLDLKNAGFTNKSAQFMRRILPYLTEGEMYSEACAHAGFNHSGYITAEENAARELDTSLSLLRKNSLRQPTVEKVLNQMINLVNSIVEEFGPIDEIRVELARELKKSKEERANASSDIAAAEKRNDKFAKLILQYGIKPSRNKIQKYRMWKEADERCVYCGTQLSIQAFLSGEDTEVEHIIPRSLLFDDSFSNKVCSCRRCNQEKKARTAFDFMSSRGEEELQKYLVRIKNMFEKKEDRISKTKYTRLQMTESEIPKDFIARDLRETQYISRKAMEILRRICRNVYASSGSVTDFFRHAWGYDNILHDLNIPLYEKGDLVVEEDYEHKGQIHKRRRIVDWNKRLDHRHHAIDALTVALTRQGYVQRLNNLNTQREFMRGDIENSGARFKDSYRLLTQWADSRPHFPVSRVADAIDAVAVSFKAGKKVATLGKAQKRADGTKSRPLVPRAPMHEESIYGKMLYPIGEKDLKYCLSHIPMVADKEIRERLESILRDNDGDVKKAIKWLKKNPVINEKTGEERTAFKCFEERMVIRYKLSTLKANQIDKIVDKAVRELVRARYDECGSEKAFEQSLAIDPLRFNPWSAPIKHVRCFARVAPESTIAIRYDAERAVGYAKSGNNHHAAFYRKPDGSIEQMVVQFWTALGRKNIGLPPVIRDPKAAWAHIENLPSGTKVEEIAASLPGHDWELIQSLQSNEMFVMGLSDDEWRDALAGNRSLLSRHLYRVRIVSENFYVFRLNTNTASEASNLHLNMGTAMRCASVKSFLEQNPHKVKITPTGKIIPIDD